MLHFSKIKIGIILLICLWAIVQALPNVLSEQMRERLDGVLPEQRLNLGLDLQGGSYLLLEVDTETYMQEQMEFALEDVRRALRDKRVGYKGLRVTSDQQVVFALRDPDQQAVAEEAMAVLPREMLWSLDGGKGSVTFRDAELERMQRNVLEQSIEIVRRRVDETGTREPVIQQQGDRRILLQVPGLQDPERLKRLLGRTAKMSFHLMDESDPYPAELRAAPPDSRLLRGMGEQANRYFMVKKRVALSGDLLVDARPTYDRGRAVVSFRFNTQGARRFAQITRQNVGKPFAVVLDGVVITAPEIQEPILGGSGQISGQFTTQSAADLALLLRAGALPAPLKVLEERTVGPSLGADSIEAGKKASMIAVALVLVFMVVVYRRFGVYSDIALLMNIVLLVACLSLFQATLTLPGIAGIILTMGMAVDANVLIFERIKEELRLGKTPFAAVEQGFAQAFKTILDSNITTLIATLLLFIYGSGPVKGFAVTLSLGIVCSMFSAIMLTRLMMVLWLRRTRPKTLKI